MSRPREQLAPALFPFLAVLLCTVGSLIVILVLSVFHAQASAKLEVSDQQDKLAIVSDEIELVSAELEGRRESIQEELLNQRSELAHYEDHITRLMEELQQVQDRAKALESSSQAEPNKMTADEIAYARKRVAEAEQELQYKVDELRKRPPAFAIVPYGGPNGTTRRPIYLECTKEGVVIQPEGLLITFQELKPPHGPGNPLDAALRLIRTEYERAALANSEGSAPYPLLMIRPDGIKTYALARSAMGGWDDQFGYELISADMPLAFPPSVPGLAPKLGEVLQVAKKRQAALMAAMPAKYSNIEFDDLEPLTGGGNEFGIASPKGTDWDDGPAPGGRVQEGGDWKVVQELPLQGGGGNMGSSNMGGGSSLRPSGASGQGFGTHNMIAGGTGQFGSSFPGNGSGMGGGGAGEPGGSFNGGSYNGAANGTGGGAGGSGGGNGGGGGSDPGNSGAMNQSPSNSGASSGGSGFFGGGMQGGSAGMGASGTDDPNSKPFGSNADSRENRDNWNNPQGNEGNATGSNSFSSGKGAIKTAPELQIQGSAAGGMSQNSPGAAQGIQGNQGTQGPQGSPGSLEGGIGYQGRPSVTDPMDSQSSSKQQKPEPSSSDSRKNRNKDDTKPIAATRGRGWAEVRAGSVKNTPVVRVITMNVEADSWKVLNEFDPKKIETVIELKEGPQAASTKLGDTIRTRVESWGVAVARGYWKPKLILRVEPGGGHEPSSVGATSRGKWRGNSSSTRALSCKT